MIIFIQHVLHDLHEKEKYIKHKTSAHSPPLGPHFLGTSEGPFGPRPSQWSHPTEGGPRTKRVKVHRTKTGVAQNSHIQCWWLQFSWNNFQTQLITAHRKGSTNSFQQASDKNPAAILSVLSLGGSL